MKITVLGGDHEIGGNKIQLQHKKTTIFLDFGMSFSKADPYFCEFIQPRKCAALTDFFELDLLPDIPGLYREDYLKHMGRPIEQRKIDAIFLSHAHADHAQYIHFIRNDIPIYCTKETKIILQALETTGTTPYNDLTSTCQAFTFKQNKKGGVSRIDRRQPEFINLRPYMVMESEQVVSIGSLRVEMLPVDHSLPGACGFIVYSDEGNLVYTGDIRFHGYHADKSKRFVQKATEIHPKWLLCEGTRINKDSYVTENDVRKTISKFMKQAKGLVLIEHPIRDLDRVFTIFLAAKENNRILVIPLKLAYLIESLGDFSPISLDQVLIFIPRKSWGLITQKNIDFGLLEKDYDTWERPFLKRKNILTAQEIQRHQKKYAMSMSLWDIQNLIDIQPTDSIWIKSSCEPFSDDMMIDEERKKRWLAHFNIQEYGAHASGHASSDELKAMIKKINPEIVIPIHTEHPELFPR